MTLDEIEDRLALPSTLAKAIAQMLDEMASDTPMDDDNAAALWVLASAASRVASLISGISDDVGTSALSENGAAA